MKYKIAFATGSRADYGIVRKYLTLLNNNKKIDLDIIVTGTLLNEEYGKQVRLIYDDGFNVVKEIPIEIDTKQTSSILKSMAQIQNDISDFFSDIKYDLLIILGDRYEMLPIAISAAMQKVRILHIHGGEATYGNYDEFIRHCITKMSTYHFTATEKYKNRVIQLGENPLHTFNLGSLGAENCIYIDENNVPKFIKQMRVKSYFVILFHPETLTNVSIEQQIQILINSIEHFKDFHFVFLGSNADTDSYIIRKNIKNYVERAENAIYIENLNTDAYHYLVAKSVCLIGNSSSGIIEAPSLRTFSINIGDRQKGRVSGTSVINVKCDQNMIVDTIYKILNNECCTDFYNPYFQEGAAQNYYDKTIEILENQDNDEPKIFYDLDRFNY